VRAGFVTSLSRPGGNITGVFFLVTVLAGKRLGLLRALIPEVSLIAVLLNPNQLDHAGQMKEVQEAARALGQQIHIVLANNESAINAAFATAAQSHAGAMSVGSDAFFNSQRDKIIALAARHSIPAAYEGREFALAGGLMSYGTSFSDAYRQVGMYAGRILKGEKPGDLPVIQSTKFEFVINLKTAKTLGLTIPAGVLSIADELIFPALLSPLLALSGHP
jgi:putative tryptophan/tyrosine transport system substrate-binding protein